MAQNITGTITGTVTDSSGAIVPNVSVSIRDLSTKAVVRTVRSDAHGAYNAPLLPVGDYALTFEAAGFEKTDIPNVTLNVGDTVTENVSLKAGNVAETVTVTANEVAPNTETPENSSVINELQMKELALNTRNFEQLLLLQPGVSYTGADELSSGLVNAAGGANAHQLSVNGLQPTQLSFNFDGADTLDHNTIAQSVLFPSVESISQVKVLRDSYGAQYGGGGSAQVLIVSKAGGDALHGDIYYFLRNQYLNANAYFNLISTPVIPRPPSHYDDFGIAAGGPLYIPHVWPKERSNTYFFYSEELRRLGTNVPSQKVAYPALPNLYGYFTGIVCVPFANGGVTSTYAACTNIGEGQSPMVTNSPYPGYNYQIPIINPVAQEYVKDMMVPTENIQQPNVANTPNTANLSLPTNTRSNQIFARIDHKFNERLSGFFRYIIDPYTINAPSGYLQNSSFPGVNTSIIYTYGENYLAHGTFTATPTTVLDFGYSLLQYEIKATPIGTAVQANSPDIQVTTPYANTTGRVPQIEINGQTWGPNGYLRELDHTQQVFENTTKQIGRHTLNFGGNYERFYETSNQGTLNAGKFVFENAGKPVVNTNAYEGIYATFLLGQPTSFTQSSRDPVAHIVSNVYEAYIQDNWRALPHLTIQAGLRYTLFGQPYDTAGNLGAFAPQAYQRSMAPAIAPADGLECLQGGTDPNCNGLSPTANYNPLNGIVQGGKNSPYGRAINRRNWLDFAPRVGFSWDVYGDQKTTLRGGYGVFYDQVAQSIPQGEVYSNPAYVQTITYASPSFAAPGGGGPQAIPLVIGGSQANWTTPYTQSYSLDVQQQLGPSFVMTMAYVGNKTFHLQGVEDINEPLPGQYAATAPALSVTGNGSTTLAATVLQPVNQQQTQDLNFVRPYPGYAAINFFDTRFFGDYNGLQVGLIKSFAKARGAHISVNYTWSKAMANSIGFTTAPQNTYNINAEWGPTASDRRDIFNTSLVYLLPFFRDQRGFKGKLLGGYQISLIVQATSGLWLTPMLSQHDSAGQGGFAASGSDTVLRLDQSGNANLNAPHTQLEYFNTSVFSYVPSNQYRPANGKVGTVEGPGFQTWNVSFDRDVNLPREFRLQLRFEAFNALNHVNFNAINVSDNTAKFGEVTSANDNRQIQVGAKLYF